MRVFCWQSGVIYGEGERVRELHDANSSDKARDGLDLGDGRADDKGKRPVDNDHTRPYEAALGA